MNDHEESNLYLVKLNILYQGIDYYVGRQEYDKAAGLIEIANEMEGHNAPQRLNLSIDDASKVILKSIGIDLEDCKSKNH